MSAFYRRMQATADRLLRQFGEPRAIVLERPADDGIGDPWDPYAVDPSTYPVTGVVLPARQGRVEAFDNTVDGGTLVDDSRRFVVISALSNGQPLPVTPRAGDRLVFDGDDWSVMGVGGSNPGGIQLTYEMGVSRA